jgi:hypothetical protein
LKRVHNIRSFVSYDCLDFCENLFLYAHSIDDIRDGDFENIKKEDYTAIIPETQSGIA